MNSRFKNISTLAQFHIITLLLTLLSANTNAQKHSPIGRFSSLMFPVTEIILLSDSTFQYSSDMHPDFFFDFKFRETGKWTITGDTIILNPGLPQLPLVETKFSEEAGHDSTITLNFHHVKRYYDKDGKLYRADTVQMRQVDFCFNEKNKKSIRRITAMPTVRCAFAGYIPKEIITSESSIKVDRPAEGLKSLFVGSYELRDFKEFPIRDQSSNRLTLIVYSNYYTDQQLRHKKILLKKNLLYTSQKPNGKFSTDNFGDRLKRQAE